MLSDRQCELLTAYVDGELDAADKDAADKLLATQPEAGEFLRSLQSDSKELHNLPSRRAPETLADAVMGTVWDTGTRRRPPPPPLAVPPPKVFPAWLGFALAAAVLAAAAVGSYYLGSLFLNRGSDNNQPTAGNGLDPFLERLLGGSGGGFGSDVSDADLGVRLSVLELHEEPVKTRLAAELKKSPSFWFDMPCASNKQTVVRLAEAFRLTGIQVLIDPSAKSQLEKFETKLSYLLYAENLAPGELLSLMEHVGKAEQSAAVKNLDRLHMTTINAQRRDVLGKLLRLDPKKLEPPGSDLTLPAMIDVPQIPTPKLQDPAKAQERYALLLAVKGNEVPQDSKEYRQYIAVRSGFRPGALQIVLVIREQGT